MNNTVSVLFMVLVEGLGATICISNLAVTRIGLGLYNVRVRLHVGDQHLLLLVEDEVMLHPDHLGHIVEEYPAWQGQSIQGECLFDPQNPSQGPWWVCWWRWRCSLPPWLSLSPSLTEISPIDPVFGDGQHSWWCWTNFGGAWTRPGPRRSPPSTWPTSPCSPTRSSPCPTIWSGSRLREGVLNKLTALLSFSRIWSGYQVFSGFSSKINWSCMRPSAQLWS